MPSFFCLSTCHRLGGPGRGWACAKTLPRQSLIVRSLLTFRCTRSVGRVCLDRRVWIVGPFFGGGWGGGGGRCRNSSSSSSNARKKGLFKRSQSYNDASRSRQDVSSAADDDDGNDDFLDDLGQGDARGVFRSGSLAAKGRNFLRRISTRGGGGGSYNGEVSAGVY